MLGQLDIKLTEDNITVNLSDLEFGDEFFNSTLKAQSIEVKINYFELH